MIARGAVIYLLQCLDFVINQKKLVLILVQNIEFLELLVNSKSMTFETDREKSPESLKILQNNSSQSEDSHLRIDQVIRPSHFHNTNSTSSSTAVLIFTTAASLSLKKEHVI